MLPSNSFTTLLDAFANNQPHTPETALALQQLKAFQQSSGSATDLQNILGKTHTLIPTELEEAYTNFIISKSQTNTFDTSTYAYSNVVFKNSQP